MATEKNYVKVTRLNPDQQQAVDSIEGPVMVLAGPGTGKTQVLTTRIAKILSETQMDPWNILCLTFTESGVAAMRERLRGIIGKAAYHVRINTFHSFCNDIIQDHPDIFALGTDWQSLSDIERAELLRELIDELPGTSKLKPFGQPYLYIRDISQNIQQLKQEDISSEQFEGVVGILEQFSEDTKDIIESFVKLKPKERTDAACVGVITVLRQKADSLSVPQSIIKLLERLHERYLQRAAEAHEAKDASKFRTLFKNEMQQWYRSLVNPLERQRDLCAVYRRYNELMRERGRYDYEDMVLMVVQEFKKNDDLLAHYQEQFQYILVDEYQDTNGAQNEIVELLGSFDDQPNIFVVGDDKQSIYRFQGASLNNMLDFYRRYQSSIKVVSLRNNYRSQGVVLQAAQSVIAHNEESIAKYVPGAIQELVAAADRPEQPISVAEFNSEEEEDNFVAEQIEQLVANGNAPESIAVLVRYNKDALEIVDMLKRLNVPVRLEAGENVLDDRGINELFTLLSYLSCVQREDILAEIIRYAWLGFNELDTLRAIHYAGTNRASLLTVLGSEEKLKAAGVIEPAKFLEFVSKLASWHSRSATTVLQNFIHEVLNESGWLDWVTAQKDSISALEKLLVLLGEAKALNRSNHELKLSEFIQRITRLKEYGMALTCEPWRTGVPAVRVMTAHKAKGLEFEYVFITRLNDRHWGNNREPGKLQLPPGFVRYDYVVARENNEDERRLFYVALTRAKQSLTLTRSLHTGSGRPTVASLFLDELPIEAIVQVEQAVPESLIGLTVSRLKPVPATPAHEVEAWLRGVLANYVMSVTHLNNYLECPHKFYIKNILRVPDVRSPHQALGSAIHNALDQWYRAGDFDKTSLINLFIKCLKGELLSESEERDIEQVGVKIIGDYWQQYQSTFGQTKTMLEYNFSSHGVTVDGVSLTGKIDKIELLNDKEVNVVDYKTGNPDNGLRKLKPGADYFRQLVFYKLLCEESPRFPYQMITGEIDFVQPSKKSGAFVKKKIEVTDKDVQELTETIKRVWQEIQNLDFLTGKTTPFCGKCEYCTKR